MIKVQDEANEPVARSNGVPSESQVGTAIEKFDEALGFVGPIPYASSKRKLSVALCHWLP
jgi:hypothetical protein